MGTQGNRLSPLVLDRLEHAGDRTVRIVLRDADSGEVIDVQATLGPDGSVEPIAELMGSTWAAVPIKRLHALVREFVECRNPPGHELR